ncbi:PEPxxWA-CTERM sorting domain-containing protein [Sandarakinorhabdus sp.]|uniref:PEPxxWA-CTERM sorting domain-containing protein n=1 Tax=Sandarakinorhabdus sp. TaxID=1916663 RepID=UPI00286DB2FF|nr:PEPxxWA-CTERM sorting domain-containing protein [Sandarakinorhabdus sp.]
MFYRSAIIVLATMLTTGANAASIIGSATGIASPTYAITFSEVSLTPSVSQVTNQFAAFGASFSPAATYTPQTGFPNIVGDTIGNFPVSFFTPFSINFTVPQTSAAFAMVSNGADYLFEALSGANVVEGFTAPVGTSANNFYGFTGVSFDSIRITNLTSDLWLIDNVQIGSTTAVPEPASWAMLIAGFGLVGAAMRRRRAAVA